MAGAGKRLTFGDVTATLRVENHRDVVVTWKDFDGRTLKAPPKSVRKAYPVELAKLKKEIITIRQTLSNERQRLEAFFGDDPCWSYREWKKNYLDHPLVSLLARNLIWTIPTKQNPRTPVFPQESAPGFVDIAGRKISGLFENTVVRFWHPIESTAAVVEAWRDFLIQRHIHQPFKQVFRETYRPMKQDEESGHVSIRFAGHILKYHVCRRLMQGRRWIGKGLGYGCGDDTTIAVRRWESGIKAEFELSLVKRDPHYGGAVLVSSGRLAFSRLIDNEWEEVALKDLPARMFSETMREMDLFVTVSGIGSDSAWRNRGSALTDAYWDRVAFGDLGEMDRLRLGILKRVIPRLPIHDSLSLTDRFLCVDGSHVYKIHVGTGHVIMSPGNQFMACSREQLRHIKSDFSEFIPFDVEEDPKLLEILKKAQFLANE